MVATARATHWDAGHHCSAFRLGPAGAIQRSSDDGEPAGTAGAPLLTAIEKAGVSDAVVVVSRWFGGILLGTGGLARAYGDAARAALERAGTRPRLLARRVEVTIGYDEAGRVETDLRESGVTVVGTRYEPHSVVLELEIPVGAVGDVRSGLSARTGGRASYSVGEQVWLDG